MAWERTVGSVGHLCGMEPCCGEWGASSAVLKVKVMRMPEGRVLRIITSDPPFNMLVSSALCL